MSNVFDTYKRISSEVVARTMGYDAVWTPTGLSTQQTARVLFREPTQKEILAGIDYMPFHYIMEYSAPDFADLKSLADSGQAITELITVNGIDYHVLSVKAKFDGATFVAKLEKV